MYRVTAVINKIGSSPVFWTFFSVHRMTHEQCEKMLSRDRGGGIYKYFKITLTEFLCEKVDKNLNVNYATVPQCSKKVKKGVKPKKSA